MNTRPYQVCVRCVMDTSDPAIQFDEFGVCNHCHEFDRRAPNEWFPNQEGAQRLAKVVAQIQTGARGKRYDSIIGLSGGIDSSYLAIKARELGLRPLAVHVDAGWNSELAVQNIERVIKYCGFDLHTHVMNWEDMKNLQLAYLRSGVANQDVPQDHAFFSSLYHYAVKNGIRTVLSGGNFATESVFPSAWHHSAMDATNLHAIFARFGSGKLVEYKTIGFFAYYLYYPFIRRMRVVRLLNYMPYSRNEAVRVLQETVGFKPYPRKHGESVFTRFFQNFYLVQRFGYDKRRPHLSSRILSGEITRDQALQELAEPLNDPRELEEDIEYFCKKLGLTEREFLDLLNAPKRDAADFASQKSLYQKMKQVQTSIECRFRTKLANYS